MCGRRFTSWRPLRTGASNEFTTSAVGAVHHRRSRGRSRCSPSWCSRRCSSAPSTHAQAAHGAGGSGAWLATAYGPPWGGIQGDGVTATGINLTAGQPMLEVAVDPSVIPLRSFVHVQPNPFNTAGAFYAGRHRRRDHRQHVDIYDWRGRADAGRVGSATGHRHPGGGSGRGQRARAGAGARRCHRRPAGSRARPRRRADTRTRSRARRASCRERIDMGVDYTGRGRSTRSARDGHLLGPVAPAGGRSRARADTAARSSTGWPTGPTPGRYVYVTEGIIPAGHGRRAGPGRAARRHLHRLHRDRLGDRGRANTMAAALGQACASGDPGCARTRVRAGA